MFLRCLFHVFASFLGVALRNGWMGEWKSILTIGREGQRCTGKRVVYQAAPAAHNRERAPILGPCASRGKKLFLPPSSVRNVSTGRCGLGASRTLSCRGTRFSHTNFRRFFRFELFVDSYIVGGGRELVRRFKVQLCFSDFSHKFFCTILM